MLNVWVNNSTMNWTEPKKNKNDNPFNKWQSLCIMSVISLLLTVNVETEGLCFCLLSFSLCVHLCETANSLGCKNSYLVNLFSWTQGTSHQFVVLIYYHLQFFLLLTLGLWKWVHHFTRMLTVKYNKLFLSVFHKQIC